MIIEKGRENSAENSLVELVMKPLDVSPEQRKLLDEEYEKQGLKTAEEKIKYIRDITGLPWTVHEEQFSREEILYSLEVGYTNRIGRSHWPKPKDKI